MIGIGLYQLQFANNDELDITRRKMVGYVHYKEQLATKSSFIYLLFQLLMLQATLEHSIRYALKCCPFLLCSVRRNAVRSRDRIQYCMETELMFQALPKHVQDQVTCYYL